MFADEPLQPPFDRADAHSSLAIALILSRDSTRALCELTKLRRATIARIPDYEHFGYLHVSAALPLLEQISNGQPGEIPLELASADSGPAWCVDLNLVTP